jgi:hypothetical protein
LRKLDHNHGVWNMNYHFERPPNACAAQLHAEIDALGHPGACIGWDETEIVVGLDLNISDLELEKLAAVVAAHNGRAAIEAASAREAAVAAVLASGAALVESARAKRIAGVTLTPSEMAATLDALLFQGSP